MTQIRVDRTVQAPATVVWDVLTDMDRWVDVVPGITDVERLDDGTGYGVGTRWRETRTALGRQATEEMQVTACEPPHHYVVEADSHGAHYRTSVRVEADGPDAATIRMQFEGTPDGAVARLLAESIGKAFQGPTRRALQDDLDAVAGAAEARARR